MAGRIPDANAVYRDLPYIPLRSYALRLLLVFRSYVIEEGEQGKRSINSTSDGYRHLRFETRIARSELSVAEHRPLFDKFETATRLKF